jgi:hypothetical protein
MPVTLGGKEITVDLSTAQEITIGLQLDVPVIVLEVVARGGGKEIGRISRSVILDDSNKVYLAELTPSSTKPGPWPLAVGMHGSIEKNMPIKVYGVAYPKGLGLHAQNPPATATYRLGKSANVFQTKVAFNDTNEGEVSLGTHFEVYGDGKLLWKSKAITAWRQLDDCVIDVTGVEELELRVAALPGRPAYGAHAVWLDPILVGPDAAAIRRASGKK